MHLIYFASLNQYQTARQDHVPHPFSHMRIKGAKEIQDFSRLSHIYWVLPDCQRKETGYRFIVVKHLAASTPGKAKIFLCVFHRVHARSTIDLIAVVNQYQIACFNPDKITRNIKSITTSTNSSP